MILIFASLNQCSNFPVYLAGSVKSKIAIITSNNFDYVYIKKLIPNNSIQNYEILFENQIPLNDALINSLF